MNLEAVGHGLIEDLRFDFSRDQLPSILIEALSILTSSMTEAQMKETLDFATAKILGDWRAKRKPQS